MAEQRTIVITGATDGLGKGLATELAPTGARLILHGRNEDKGQALLEELRPRTTGELAWRRADFASLDEVRDLADELLDEQRIDALVNNAGIGSAGPREESQDGYELTFQVDYLAPSADAKAADVDQELGPLSDRQRQLRRPGPHRLRRRDAGGELQRGAGLLSGKARSRHAHLRPRRGAGGDGRHRQLPPPRHLHADQHGPPRGS